MARDEHESRRGPDELDDLLEVTSDDGTESMTMAELREALDDEHHPRHSEALRLNDELAKQIRPALAQLQELNQGVSNALSGAVARIRLPSIAMPEIPFHAHEYEYQRRRAESFREQQTYLDRLAETAAEDAEEAHHRQELEDQRAQQTLAVLMSMEASLRRLSTRTDDLGEQIRSGNTSSSKAARWTIIIAALTLLATIVGIAATVVINAG
ncbi:hypothetical protein [Actinomyces urogenitalis]|uniref:hypothetical protein n=1 Tax=Actinomyces urogenitalis TaxID=103621 RepID=UPI002954621B|nr:hypothetical protein [Actinomyces urogenitalis]WOO94253.1 hypothetical protein R3I39_05900 [Actinomyces urogenitalis]